MQTTCACGVRQPGIVVRLEGKPRGECRDALATGRVRGPLWRLGGEVMTKRCKNCKHWSEPPKWRRTAHGDCSKITLANESPDALAYAQDGSDYVAGVLCKEDFGCKLWEKKP